MRKEEIPDGFADVVDDNGFSNDFFDPFGLGADAMPRNFLTDDTSSTGSPHPPPAVNRLNRSTESKQTPEFLPGEQPSSPDALFSIQKSIALPPKIMVKFSIHEEVSSLAKFGVENEGASEVHIEGKLHAQIQSSDALKNVPFALVASTLKGGRIQFSPNTDYVLEPSRPSQSIPAQTLHIVNIPKLEIGSVPLGSYVFSEQVRHMPLLVERKVTIHQSVVRIAVQVRSKLSNKGDLHDFTIAVALPERVNIETVELVKGKGSVDELKRTIKWTMPDLTTGESFMVSAHAKLWTEATSDDESTLRFPVLLRCSSSVDQISSIEVRATEADDFPATVSFSRAHTFRLLHRLT